MSKSIEVEAATSAISGAGEREAASWTDFSYFRWNGTDKPKSKLGKVGLEQFLAENQLPHLKVLRVFERASDISFENLPDCFVLKPASLWSGVGVMLLHKICRHSAFFDAKSNQIVTREKVKEIAKAIEKKNKKELQFIVEERAIDEDANFSIPFDYKVFTFHGKTKFVFQVDRNHPTPKIAFFDGNFKPILDDRVLIPEDRRIQSQGTHRIPKCADQMLSLAREITIKLKAAFISVDCYATDKGATFGELTHTPGGPWYGTMYRFSDAFDRELGTEWAQACRRLNLPIRKISVPYEIKANDRVSRIVY